MKKIIGIIAIASMVISCSNNKKTNEETKQTDSTSVSSQAADAAAAAAQASDTAVNKPDSLKK